eukprot:TRINITY_DN12644_c0_g1_i1.p4 TRINITY_DN12644_c0_g1~~TRINITY_DN12644_c0_g1_i1.p4  ORF type:complete len:94 (-),score=14.16 TRINITY_DN12644_c0_g1_i1:157-438(-)
MLRRAVQFLFIICVLHNAEIRGENCIDGALVFEERFNSLHQWTGKDLGSHNAQIREDPFNSGRGSIVEFTENVGGGDIFTIATFSHGDVHNRV